MASKVYVYSTLTAPQHYVEYNPLPEGAQVRTVAKGVHIKGGANLANKFLQTPRGIVTIITPEEYGFLKQCDAFQLHVKNGYITVDETKRDPEKVAEKELKPRDESAPLRPQDYEKNKSKKEKPVPVPYGEEPDGQKLGS